MTGPKRLSFWFALLLIITSASCERSLDTDDVLVFPVPTSRIQITLTTGNTISFSSEVPGVGCDSFSNFEDHQNGHERFIKIFLQEPKVRSCSYHVIFIDVTIELFVVQSGSYTFHFWQSDTSSLDTTVTVP